MKIKILFSTAMLAAAVLFSSASPQSANAYACNGRHYINVDGKTIHSPSCGSKKRHVMAICRDGSRSFSMHTRGTCSRHRGVRRWN
jgi:Protein of unknown function (DUF3761)